MDAPGHTMTLYTRVGCHLCADAKETVARVAGQTGVAWTEVDVDADRDLAYEYGDRVPVLLVDGHEHAFWRVEEARLLRALGSQ